MRSIFFAGIITLLAANAIAQTGEEATSTAKPKERLGIRLGYVSPTSNINASFGDGLQASIHWMQPMWFLSLDIELGMFVLGETSRSDLTDAFFIFPIDDVSLRIPYFTIAPTLVVPITGKLDVFGRVGAGLYVTSFEVVAGLSSTTIDDNRLGVNFGGGVLWQIAGKVFLDFDFFMHRIYTSKDQNDLFFLYSEGDGEGTFYQISAGVLLNLF